MLLSAQYQSLIVARDPARLISLAPDTTKSAQWNRGAYLVEGLGHCGMCHTPIDKLGGNSESKAFQGGLIPMQDWYAPSLTSNKETGLGDWSLQDIEHYLQKEVSVRGAVYGPMSEVVYNSLQYMTDEDIRAIAVYLQSLAQRNSAAREVPAVSVEENSLLMQLGGKVYSEQCAICHGAKGRGEGWSRSRHSEVHLPLRCRARSSRQRGS